LGLQASEKGREPRSGQPICTQKHLCRVVEARHRTAVGRGVGGLDFW